MDDPILRRLPEVRQPQQPGIKVTLPPINHIAPVETSARVAGSGSGTEPPVYASTTPAPTSAARSASASPPTSAIPAISPPPANANGLAGAPGAPGDAGAAGLGAAHASHSPPPDVSLHQPLRPKTRTYSSSAAATGLARRRHSSGAQQQPVLAKPGTMAKSRSKSTSLSARGKLRAESFSHNDGGSSGSGGAAHGKPLNTHSPIAVAAAAAVTSERLSRLLTAQGPLPIRHITSHLAATIPGFGELSPSKQRRLIIAVIDGPKSEFVKVGWGRWAVRGHTTDSAAHRESISNQLPDSKPPLSPSLRAIEDSAVFSDSDSDSDEELEDEKLGGFEDDEVEGTDEEDWRAMGPASLRQTSPREQDAIAALVQLRSV